MVLVRFAGRRNGRGQNDEGDRSLRNVSVPNYTYQSRYYLLDDDTLHRSLPSQSVTFVWVDKSITMGAFQSSYLAIYFITILIKCFKVL